MVRLLVKSVHLRCSELERQERARREERREERLIEWQSLESLKRVQEIEIEIEMRIRLRARLEQDEIE